VGRVRIFFEQPPEPGAPASTAIDETDVPPPTPAQGEVLAVLCQAVLRGRGSTPSNHEIGRVLHRSTDTIKSHIARMLAAYSEPDRHSLARRAVAEGWVSREQNLPPG